MSAWDRPTTGVTGQTSTVDQGLRSYMLKVYNYMASGVLLTAIVAYFAGTSSAFQQMLITVGPEGASMSPLFWVIAFAPVGMAFLVLPRMGRMSEANAKLAFWGYAALMGLSLWSLFAVYTEASIFRVLLITAGTFGLLSIYGYTTKRDLSSLSSFLSVGVLAVFAVSIANIFMKSSGLDLALSYVGVLLSLGLTVYYTQQTKEIYYHNGGAGNVAIIGALNLYFAFVYLFINLMRLMGDRR